jgi:hypothetical protein
MEQALEQLSKARNQAQEECGQELVALKSVRASLLEELSGMSLLGNGRCLIPFTGIQGHMDNQGRLTVRTKVDQIIGDLQLELANGKTNRAILVLL